MENIIQQFQSEKPYTSRAQQFSLTFFLPLIFVVATRVELSTNAANTNTGTLTATQSKQCAFSRSYSTHANLPILSNSQFRIWLNGNQHINTQQTSKNFLI